MARSNNGHTMIAHIHPLTNVPTKYQLPTHYGFRDTAQTIFFRSRSHHDDAHLQPPTNAPTKCQLPTPYGC